MSRVLPILFNTDMVRAILDGRKTVTRRICKDANEYTVPDMSFYDADKRTYAVHNYADADHAEKLSIAERTCPICPGDILYVRETWQECCRYTVHSPITHCKYCYRASGESAFYGCIEECGEICNWRPSIHMPKEAARIWLRVKDVRAERLQEIDDSGAYSEGAGHADWIYQNGARRCEFAKLWNSTIKKSDLDRYGWDASPWVWAIEFERCEKPEGW